MLSRLSLFLLLLLLCCPSAGQAAKHQPVPEDCSTSRDDDGNGLVNDGCPHTDAFAACTGGYCANFKDGILAGSWAAVVDAQASSGTYARNPVGQTYNGGQIALPYPASVTTGDYYLTVRFRGTLRNLLWVSLSPLPLVPTNTIAAQLTGTPDTFTFAGGQVGSLDVATNIVTGTNGTLRRLFHLTNGVAGAVYVMAQPGVDLDCAYLSTDANATPICPSGSGAGNFNYEIYKLSGSAPTSCADGQFGQATVVNWAGYNGTSEAAPTVKILHDATKFYICALLPDTNLIAPTTTNDSDAIFSGNDRLEWNWRNSQSTGAWDATTWKLAINCNPSGGVYDANYPSGNPNTATSLSVSRTVTNTGTLDGVANDTSCQIFASFTGGFSLTDGLLFNGDLLRDNQDATDAYRIAFGTNPLGFNNAATWGTFKVSGTAVPGPPADTTAPTFPDTPDCAISAITDTAAVFTCTVAETGTVPVQWRVRYGTSTGAYTVTGGWILCTGASSPYTCTGQLTALSAGTTYYVATDAKDGAGNTGTSAEQNFSTTSVSTERFVTPGGATSGACGVGTPCTLAYAVSIVQPGETLTLADGTYPRLSMSCNDDADTSTPRNGTAALPITLQAANARQALIDASSSGLTALWLYQCNYWVLDGLHLRSGDVNAGGIGSDGFALDLNSSNHLTVRHCLLDHPNRYHNVHLMEVLSGSANVIEDNEFYYYHRHALALAGATGTVIRRNYFNSRNYADIPPGSGGYASDPTTMGDDALAIYPGTNSVVENNIAEHTGIGFVVIAAGAATNNTFSGNIVLSPEYFGSRVEARGATLGTMPQNNTFRDFLVVNPSSHAFYPMAAKNTRCDNCSFLATTAGRGGGYGSAACYQSGMCGDGAPTSFGDNDLIVGVTGLPGIDMAGQSDFLFRSPWAYNNSPNFAVNGSSSTDSRFQSTHTTDPGLGTCWVYAHSAAALIGAGLNGADIGANIIYETVDGVLTSTPLWDAANSYQFAGCGAIVTGVNDTTGNKCTDVQARLHVGAANGCTLPY